MLTAYLRILFYELHAHIFCLFLSFCRNSFYILDIDVYVLCMFHLFLPDFKLFFNCSYRVFVCFD